MQNYNFDEIINRHGTGAVKTDALKEMFGKTDLIPMWVADMDFRTGDFILDALRERCNHGILGYTMAPDNYFPSIQNWIKKKHQWEVEQDWIRYIPGIVKGIAFCIMNFTKPGDKVIIQPPVYHPFHLIPEMHKRTVVNNNLYESGGKYKMDLSQLRKNIDKNCKLLILCNPHNPIGITWDKETLTELAEICYENNILVISDEIHCDLALFNNKHIPFASVSEKAKSNSITFMAPSKTFNIAGIVSSYAIIPDPLIRNNFYNFLHSSELDQGSIFAYIATQAAYEHGEEWLTQLINYLEKNIILTKQFIEENIPQIKVIIPQASFLIWLDCRELSLDQTDLVSFFINKAHLALNDGKMFGTGGEGFMRMNVGCPQNILIEALGQLKKAINEIG